MNQISDNPYVVFKIENRSNDNHKIKEIEIVDVIVNGEFKAVVFTKIDNQCFIGVGKVNAYNYTCYWNSYSVHGSCLLGVDADWYEVSQSEGNSIYKTILSTKKNSKKGTPYYKWNIK